MAIKTLTSMPVKRAVLRRPRHRTGNAAEAPPRAERGPPVGTSRRGPEKGGRADAAKVTGLRAVPRLAQILAVAARHKLLPAMMGSGGRPRPKELREAFEELGLVFLKFGQVLAMRPDLLPAGYAEELESLHDELPAMEFDIVRITIERDLGAPLTELFSSFEETPLAAATIAQVHEATLHDGRKVAVKVQRPDLQATIARDIAALTTLIALGERLFPSMRALDLPVVVEEFSRSLGRELDFSHEARSIVLFRTALVDFPDLWIPNVVTALSSGAVLTLEFSPGERIDHFAKLHPEAMPRVINGLVRLMLQTIFEEGIFHADPHPGNVFVLPDGRLSLLDFGNTGELDERMRESLMLLLEAIVKGDARAATEAYLEMAAAGEEVNRAGLLADMKAALYEIRRTSLSDVSIGNAFDSLMSAGSRNGVHNPPEFLLLTRAFVILESMVGQLAPDHNYMHSFHEEIERLTALHFAPERIKTKTTQLARDMERLVSDAPGDARRILRRIAEGDLGRLPGLEALGARLSRNITRLASAISFAALVIGGSMLLLTPMGGWHHVLGEAMIVGGVVGMLVAGVRALRRGQVHGQH
ncbi:MAG: AarF/UbiB family protein [Rubrivivax sp.]|nr:AarF/UbiB family protein [Rubrivivax sp.]